ncbi:hypothetical protein PCASD_06801 [Puccinia coronata f. sp. avenae]|uniref:Uncharacterized protein n=1 Tax=Puccinia coronata f. sp. avenae TaxID=200324 RepID=A0A2N5UQE5_9BASI|nr:hypothetical protein PCASD_06801 [Puccinia coronata f. sp. avenae]
MSVYLPTFSTLDIAICFNSQLSPSSIEASMTQNSTQADCSSTGQSSTENGLQTPHKERDVTDETPGIALSPLRYQKNAILKMWNSDLSLQLNDIALDGDLVTRALEMTPDFPTPKKLPSPLPPKKACPRFYENRSLPPLPPNALLRRRVAMIRAKPKDQLPNDIKVIDFARKPISRRAK